MGPRKRNRGDIRWAMIDADFMRLPFPQQGTVKLKIWLIHVTTENPTYRVFPRDPFGGGIMELSLTRDCAATWTCESLSLALSHIEAFPPGI